MAGVTYLTPDKGQTGNQYEKAGLPYFAYLTFEGSGARVEPAIETIKIEGSDGENTGEDLMKPSRTLSGTVRVKAGGEELCLKGHVKSKTDPGDATNQFVDDWWQIDSLRITSMMKGHATTYEITLLWEPWIQARGDALTLTDLDVAAV